MALRFASIKALLGFAVCFVNMRVSSGEDFWDVPNEALINEVYAVADEQPWNYMPNLFTAGVGGVSISSSYIGSLFSQQNII